jgi:hypothetical protein
MKFCFSKIKYYSKLFSLKRVKETGVEVAVVKAVIKIKEK